MREPHRVALACALIAAAFAAPANADESPATPTGADERRIWLSVGGGAALGTIDWTSGSTWEEYQEDARLEVVHEAGPGPAFEAAVGVRLSPRLGLAATLGWSRRSTDASIDALIPHPFHFDRPRPLGAEVTGLDYEEWTSHFDLEWRPLVGRTEITVFGGVCLARVKADLVERVEYDDEYPYDEVSFRSAVTQRVNSDAGVGWSVGAAASRAVGDRWRLALRARYTRARVDLSPPEGDTTSVDAGGLKLTLALGFGF